MNILHVFSTFDIGGPQVRFANMVNSLGEEYKHSVIAMDERYDARCKVGAHVNIDFPQFKHDKSASLFKKVMYFRRLIKAVNPSVVVTYNWGAIEWAIACLLIPNVKHLHFEEGFGPEEKSEQLPRRVWFRRLVLRWKALIIVPSQTLEDIATKVWKIPHSSVRYLANGINVPDKMPDTKTFTAGDKITIGTLARLRKEKNLIRMIDAVSALNENVQLLIGGSGDEEKVLADYIKENSLEDIVILCGNQKNPYEFMDRLDLFCMSSDTEQMPLSVLEAMASGLPVISTDVGDVKSMVCEHNRKYIHGRTAQELTNNLSAALNNQADWPEIASDNFDKVSAYYSTQAMNATFEKLVR